MGESAIWLGVLAILVVAAVAAVSWRSRRERAIARHMQSTEGLLEEIGIRKVRGRDGKHFWVVFGRYSYSVGGRQYTGNRITLEANPHATEAAAMAALGDRKAGQAVTVRYDPKDPATTCLDEP